MNTLQTIQKTFRVFQIPTKVAFILSIVGAAICAVGALCSITWYTGGQVFTLFGEPITFFIDSEGANQAMAVLLSDLVMLTTDAILLGFAGRYFKIEQAEGTPFTANGAELLKKLGIRCIYMPIVAVVIATVIMVSLGTEESGDLSNLPGVVTGIVLILASIIFRYGAELEQKVKTENEER
ncbi:MAG: hypothetical protein ACI4LQ_01425 [Anaerovoracaceae bacterium]